jgi:tRNA-splicing ligase RtcB (3'-phosphate/5'-hydroxy nucleic acid ligase)
MVRLQDLRRVNEYEWEIPVGFRPDMRVPVHIFATQKLLEKVMGDKSLEQAVNATTLPGLVGKVYVMPDMHQGYGFPIGGVAATELPEGVISPGAIGYDINCGVRLLASSIDLDTVSGELDDLASALNHYCPSGVGSDGALRLSLGELEQVCRDGARFALKRGMASEADLRRTEESGCIAGADPEQVSKRAKDRGRSQLGSLGAGNHFIEVDVVDEIFWPAGADAMGLRRGCLVLQIHCGSRGFGHQVCTDYVHEFQSAVHRYGIKLPDRELVCAPLNSPEGKNYLAAMRAAANFAFANRQVLAFMARKAFEETLAGRVPSWQLHQVYDIAHNMGKIETHTISGRDVKVCVHRKGATRAFGPGSPDVPPEYTAIGQPVLVPGSMGTASWVLTGTSESMERSLGSTCHGAGRVMSRSQAKKTVRGEKLRQELEASGIHVRAGSLPGLAEEAPSAYKDVDQVVETVSGAGIARKVARLTPVAVVKG